MVIRHLKTVRTTRITFIFLFNTLKFIVMLYQMPVNIRIVLPNVICNILYVST